MSAKSRPLHPAALSIDLEFWWCSELLRGISLGTQPEIIGPASVQLLNLLDEFDIRATFFVLGEVAEKYPDLILRIRDGGHEIANHGYSHRNVFELSPAEFEADLVRSTEILTGLTSQKPLGYRAPNFSFDARTSWAYDILSKHGYRYSSSVFPFKTRLYGVPDAPLRPYRPSSRDIRHHDEGGAVWEFPATVVRILGRNLPVSGGFYFRLLPGGLLRRAFGRVLRDRPAVFYLHLRDLYRDPPRPKKLPLTARIFHFWGLKRAEPKFRNLLQNMDFIPVSRILGLD